MFKRFYNEVTYYGETMRQIREYEEVFEDKLEDDAKIQLLGYQIKNGKWVSIKKKGEKWLKQAKNV